MRQDTLEAGPQQVRSVKTRNDHGKVNARHGFIWEMGLHSQRESQREIRRQKHEWQKNNTEETIKCDLAHGFSSSLLFNFCALHFFALRFCRIRNGQMPTRTSIARTAASRRARAAT